jgi:hypothetical protein
MSTSRPPRAVEVPGRGGLVGPSWAWLLPALALGLVLLFGWQSWRKQGLVITVRAEEGHGLRVGDALRFRGIAVGEIRTVRLSADAAEILLSVALEPGARELARAGSRFWVVRPHVSLDGITGLETLVGARYLTCLPGLPGGPIETEFRALAEPPVTHTNEPGGLEIRLQADRRHGLRRGAPLSFRGIEIGSVLDVQLASDATGVEVRAYVLPAYAGLVRRDSRFWEVSGLDVSLGLSGGLSVQFESTRALLVGGIAMATPSSPGEPAHQEQLFRLHERPDKEWLEWRAPLPIGGAGMDGPGPPLPQLSSALRGFKARRYLARTREVSGLVLRVGEALVGPADVLAPTGVELSPALSIDGLAVHPGLQVLARGLGAVRVEAPGGTPAPEPPVPPLRALGEPEPCLLVSLPGTQPLALDPARLTVEEGQWRVQASLNPGPAWHGAAVIARSDGAWIGLLLVEGRQARIVPVPVPEASR